jgi:hypothetical protein
MTKYHWARTCPTCAQGRLLILENRNAGGLYLHCESCEMGFLDPDKASAPEDGFSTLDEEFVMSLPTSEEIEARGWTRHVAGTFEG